ncbi:MAG: subclass B3 metallo-beta-lactamase, partial [Vicinamibacterales bacterium]
MRSCATRFLFVAVLIVPALPSAQQTGAQRAAWNQPVEPFRIIGNVNYVGAAGVSAFLITTPSGSILLDGGLPETVAQIARNIETLGFKVADVKYLLNSHAHFDHAGGLAELKKLSGAAFVASTGDAEALKSGGPSMPAVDVDRIIKDGDTLTLGDTTLTARVTPGHTKGCTTWTMTATDNGRPRNVLFYCSTSVVDRLVGNTGYPGIVADYERSFTTFRSMKADVFLANHPVFFGLEDKRTRMAVGRPNPFIDPAELGRFVDSSEQQF